MCPGQAFGRQLVQQHLRWCDGGLCIRDGGQVRVTERRHRLPRGLNPASWRSPSDTLPAYTTGVGV